MNKMEDMMLEILKAILLGIIEGITDLFPINSTGIGYGGGVRKFDLS